jgi:hypothetical protein
MENLVGKLNLLYLLSWALVPWELFPQLLVTSRLLDSKELQNAIDLQNVLVPLVLEQSDEVVFTG